MGLKLNSSTISLWWFPVLTVIVMTVCMVTVFVPQTRNLVTNQKKLTQEKLVLEKAESKFDQVDALKEEDLREKIDLTLTALPDHKPYYEVLSTLQVLASNTGVLLGNFDLNPGSLSTPSAKTKEKKQNDELISLQTKITARGTLEQITKFIESIQKSLPLITVKTISINETNEDNLEVSLIIVMSHAPETNNSSNEVSFEPLPSMASDTDETLSLLAEYQDLVGDSTGSSVTNLEREDVFNF